jgi:hypothetical protein
VYIFGGFEAGIRVNSICALNVVSSSWEIIKPIGIGPSSRSYHACCSYNDFMIIHGGEGPLNIAPNSTENGASKSIISYFILNLILLLICLFFFLQQIVMYVSVIRLVLQSVHFETKCLSYISHQVQ